MPKDNMLEKTEYLKAKGFEYDNYSREWKKKDKTIHNSILHYIPISTFEKIVNNVDLYGNYENEATKNRRNASKEEVKTFY